MISGDDACLSIVWDLNTQKPISQWHGYNRVWVVSAALSPDGKTAFTAEYAGSRSSFDRPAAQARFWNADDGKLKLDLLKVWTPKTKDEDRVDSYGYARTWGNLMKRGLICAVFSPDGKWLAVGQGGETDTGKIHLVDVETGTITRTVSGHRYGACDVKFPPTAGTCFPAAAIRRCEFARFPTARKSPLSEQAEAGSSRIGSRRFPSRPTKPESPPPTSPATCTSGS